MSRITTLEELESLVGKVPAHMELKIIDHIDAIATQWVKAANLIVLSLGSAGSVVVTLGGGPAGFLSNSHEQLVIPLNSLDHPEKLHVGQNVGTLIFIPGLLETLRVNGRVSSISISDAVISVEECFGHCAKALIRSEFWSPNIACNSQLSKEKFIDLTRFLAFATSDGQGHCDLSPKGDPAGLMVQFIENEICFADRPGNRRMDSFRNLVTQGTCEAILMVPGEVQVAHLKGSVYLSTDQERLTRFAVKGKSPTLLTCWSNYSLDIYQSEAIRKANLWPTQLAPDGLKPSSLFVAHIKLNKRKGVAAAIARSAVSVPGVMERSLREDYKKNLY
ncbi:MAG: hypothetical protein JKX81_11490 [Arenicella sp.]|nr:hypothetical protein [Arenicella sp.]